MAAAQTQEMRGVDEAGPPGANGGDGGQGRRWDPREALEQEVVRERGDGGGGGGGDALVAKNVGLGLGLGVGLGRMGKGFGVVWIGEAGFHEPREVARVAAL